MVSVTSSASAGSSTAGSRSTRRNTTPVSTAAGRRVRKTFSPLCRPTPVARITFLRVRWASMLVGKITTGKAEQGCRSGAGRRDPRGHGGPRGRGASAAPTPVRSVCLALRERRDVQVAAVVAEGGIRGRLGRRGAAAAAGLAAAAQGRGDAIAGAERLGHLVDHHPGGSVALALVVDQLHLRAAV